eukprot:Pgem_evm1s14220
MFSNSKLFSFLTLAFLITLTQGAATTGGTCAADVAVTGVNGSNAEFKSTVDTLSRRALGAGSTVAKCLKVDVYCPVSNPDPSIKVSDACADCIGDTVTCGTQHCSSQCLISSTSQKCESCISTNCGAAEA